MAEAAPEIFLSYTRTDSRYVYAVADELSQQGVTTTDTGELRFGSGTSWVDPVAETLAASDVVILFLGTEAKWPWQLFEIGVALAGGKQIVPVYLSEEAMRTAIRDIRELDGIDAHARTPRQIADQIIRAIRVAA